MADVCPLSIGIDGPEMPSHVGCGKDKKKQNKGWLNYQLHNNITNDEDPTGYNT